MSDEITALLAYVDSATLAPIEPGLRTLGSPLGQLVPAGRR